MLKTLLLAIAAMATLALPTLASASGIWTHEGVPITAHTTISATGPIGYTSESGAGGSECETAHIKITITANQTASHVTEFNCTNPQTFGAMKEVFGCHIEGIHTELPFAATPTAATIDITDISVVTTMNPGCLVGEEIILSDGSVEPVTATPDNTEAMSSVAWGGEVESSFGPSRVEGTLAITPAKTYGIE